MIRTLLFAALVLLFGCGEKESPSESIDPGYSMQVQCMHVPEDKTYPCKLTPCMEMDSCTGLFKVTFTQNFLDSIDIRFFNWMCDSLPWLNFEYEETYDSKGNGLESAIMCGAKADKNLLMKNDSITFYIVMHDPHPKAAYSILGNDFWIDSAGYLVPYQFYFYNPISKGYGFRRRILSSNYVSLPRRPDIENTIINRFQFEKARFEMYKLHILKDCIGKFIFFEGTGLVGSAETLEVEFTLDTFMYRGDTLDYKFRAGFEFKNKLYRAWADGKADYDMVDCFQVSYLKNGYIPVVSLCGDGGYLLYDAKSFQEKEAQFLQCYFSYDGAIHPWLQWYVKTRYFL